MARKAMRDVIVFLPGVTGSVLQKDGKDLWKVGAGAVLRALVSLGDNLDALKLDEDPPDLDDLGDGVTAPSVMHDVHLIPGLWKIDGYTKMINFVTETFDVEAGKNFFEFPYDWRRDNRVAARKLAQEGRAWLAEWRERSGASDAKLILVGHSMGGLVSRYFLECLDGWRDTRVLVTFGTPYRGAPKSAGALVNGFKRKIGPISLDLTELVRSFTSGYQLLPVYPCYDGGAGGKLARLSETEVPRLDAAKTAAAMAFHDEIREAVEAHEQDEEYRRGRYDIRPVVGIQQPTSQSIRLGGEGVELLKSYEGDDLGGDGTVPRVSAVPLELGHEENAMFTSERHGSLQNEDGVLVQLKGVLSGLDLDFSVFRSFLPTIGLGLDLEDVYDLGEPLRVRVRPEEEPPDPLLAEAVDVETGAATRATLKRAEDGWHEAELGPLPEGVYRLTAFGTGAVEPVSDVFAVLSGEAA
jgi:pimeloyl-ACP methyl ester carboxylesterase